MARRLASEGHIRGVEFAKIPLKEAYAAREIFLTGTSLNILPVVSYDGKRIGTGMPGEAVRRLSHLMLEDMTQNQELLTPVHWETPAGDGRRTDSVQ